MVRNLYVSTSVSAAVYLPYSQQSKSCPKLIQFSGSATNIERADVGQNVWTLPFVLHPEYTPD